MCVAPAELPAPTYLSSNGTAIKIKWEPPASTGGCPVTQYQLFLDIGSGFTEIAQSELLNKPYIKEYTASSELGAVGVSHSFKVRASNVIDSV